MKRYSAKTPYGVANDQTGMTVLTTSKFGRRVQQNNEITVRTLRQSCPRSATAPPSRVATPVRYALGVTKSQSRTEFPSM